MIDLTKKVLRNSLSIGGALFSVKTDFHYWLSVSFLLEEQGALLSDFDFIFENGAPPRELAAEEIQAIVEFLSPKDELPRDTGEGSSERTVDFVLDADLIYSAFWEQYGINLTDADLHWHQFLALFKGLHGTKFNEVASFRLYLPTQEKYEDYMRKMKRAWDLPIKESAKEKAEWEAFNEVFGGNKKDV